MVLPGMSDGRVFTSYVSSCVLDTSIKELLQLNTNNEYTEHLRKYSNDILDQAKNTYVKRLKDEQWWN